MYSKQELRRYIKQKRKELDITNISGLLVKKLVKLNEYKSAKNVMLYYPLEYEVDLLEITKDSSKNFYLPKINGKELLCCPFEKDSELCLSCLKTKEPISAPVEKSLIDLVIVPALAVDEKKYRLGYGGGFYDRFLEGLDCIKLTCVPKELIVYTVFPEEHDIKMDIVIST